jgi:hypothetical protein
VTPARPLYFRSLLATFHRSLLATFLSFPLVLAAGLLSAQASKPTSLPAGAASRPLEPAIELPRQDLVVQEAMGFAGVPYVHGGDTRQGLDCSGLVYRVFTDMAGLALPRSVGSLFRSGTEVAHPLHLGDLLFFDTSADGSPRNATHVGVYAGNDTFVHAASEGSRTGVTVSSLGSPYYHDRFLGARRVLPWRPPVLSITLTDELHRIVQASPFPSRVPLAVRVYNGMTGGGPVDLILLWNGRTMLSRTIVPGSKRPFELVITPEIGEWTACITRIFKGRELQSVTFPVVE